MPFDVLFRKSFRGIVVALVALAAFFQASGVVQLVASSALALDEDSFVSVDKGKRAIAGTSMLGNSRAMRSAEPIISRNPFDSVTGPLNAPPPVLEEPDKPGKVDLSNPLSAQTCAGIQVNIVTESPDPEWSLTNIKGPADSSGIIRRVGDKVADKEIVYIGYNAEKASPAVWLLDSSALCQALLFGEDTPAAAPAKPAAPAAKPEEKKPAPRSTARRGRAQKIPAEMAAKIKKVSETEFNIDRSLVDEILNNQATLMRSARIVPEQKNGETVGIRLFGIRPDTLLGSLGMQNGDRLEEINGFKMGSPEDALQAYARLRTANGLKVKLTRRGKPVNIDYAIK